MNTHIIRSLIVINCLTFLLAQGRISIGTFGDDYAYSLVRTSRGDYVLAGSIYPGPLGNYDIYVVKVNKNGNLLWTRMIGGAQWEGAGSVAETHDGGYVVAGSTGSYGQGNGDVYVIKLDSNGNLIWTRTIGGPIADRGNSIIVTRDKHLLVVGMTASYGAGGQDVYVVKLDSSGYPVWTRAIGGWADDWGHTGIEARNGDYIVCGYTYSYGVSAASDAYIIRLDSAGNVKWARSIGGQCYEQCNSIIETSDGYLIMVGRTSTDFGGGSSSCIFDDVYVAKLDSSGNVIWAKAIGGPSIDQAYDVVEAYDGGYLVVGHTRSYGDASGSVYIIKLDSAGNVEWTRVIGGGAWDYGYSVVKSGTGKYVIGGITYANGIARWDMYMLSIDSNGNFTTLCSELVDSGFVLYSGGLVSGGYALATGGLIDSGGIIDSGGSVVSCGVLSAERLYLTGELMRERPGIKLRWRLRSQRQPLKWIIERCTGICSNSYGRFDTVAILDAASMHRYEWVDTDLVDSEVYYYRVGAMFEDGYELKSNVIVIAVDDILDIWSGRILVLSGSDRILIRVQPNYGYTGICVRLVGMDGTIRWGTILQEGCANQTCLVSLEGFPAGLYLLEVRDTSCERAIPATIHLLQDF